MGATCWVVTPLHKRTCEAHAAVQHRGGTVRSGPASRTQQLPPCLVCLVHDTPGVGRIHGLLPQAELVLRLALRCLVQTKPKIAQRWFQARWRSADYARSEVRGKPSGAGAAAKRGQAGVPRVALLAVWQVRAIDRRVRAVQGSMSVGRSTWRYRIAERQHTQHGMWLGAWAIADAPFSDVVDGLGRHIVNVAQILRPGAGHEGSRGITWFERHDAKRSGRASPHRTQRAVPKAMSCGRTRRSV